MLLMALWSMFGPRVIIGTYINVVYQLMLHTKYHGCRPGGFGQEHFFYVFTICNAM